MRRRFYSYYIGCNNSFGYFAHVYRLNVSYIASYHSNGTLNTSQISYISSNGPMPLYIGQNNIDLWQKTLKYYLWIIVQRNPEKHALASLSTFMVDSSYWTIPDSESGGCQLGILEEFFLRGQKQNGHRRLCFAQYICF